MAAESLPATAAGPSTSAGNASKKPRRQTTTGVSRRASLPETGGDADSTASSSSKRAPSKRKSLSNRRVVSDSSDSSEIEFLSDPPAPTQPTSRRAAAAAIGANIGDKGKGKQREGANPVSVASAESSVAVAAPAATGVGSKDARPSAAPSAAPRSQDMHASSSTATQPLKRKTSTSTVPGTASNGSRAAAVGAAPSAPADGVKAAAVGVSAGSASTLKRSAPSAPAPSTSTFRRPQPAILSSNQPASSSTKASHPATGQPHTVQRPTSHSAAPSSSAPVARRKSAHGPRDGAVDEEEAIVEDALDPGASSADPSSAFQSFVTRLTSFAASVKVQTGLSASQPLTGSSKPRKLSGLASADIRSGSWSALGSGAMGPGVMRSRLTDQAPVHSETDSDAEKIDDQEIIALPHPSGETDEGVRRQRRSYSPANKRYLEAAALNKALRQENKELRKQVADLSDTRAVEAAEKAELEAKATELAKERTAHAASRSAARLAEQEVDSLSKEVDVLKTRLRDAANTELFLREQYNSASEAARERAKEAMALEGNVQRLKKQLSLGVAQVKAYYAAQIGTHDGAVDTLRTQVALLQQQHQRTGDGIRDQAARVPSLEREVGLLRRTIADLRDSLAEAQEDRDLAESRVLELEDEARELVKRRHAQTAYVPESDLDDSDEDYRPPCSTPAPAAPSQAARLSDHSSDEDSPLSQLVRSSVEGVLASLDADLGTQPGPDAAPTDALLPFPSSSPSSSGSPTSSVVEMPSANEPAGQYHAIPSRAGLVPLADLHPSPNSVFGSQNGLLAPLEASGIFPAGTVSLQGLERGFGSQ